VNVRVVLGLKPGRLETCPTFAVPLNSHMSIAAQPSSPAAHSTPASRTAGGRVFNFNAGPSILPEEVLRQVQGDIWDFQGSGFGIMEHSHRAKVYDDVIRQTEADVRAVGNVPANFRVLFMSGGSSSQNFIVPANLLPADKAADYIVTGYWGQRSYDDADQWAKSFGGRVHLAATSADTNHSYIPERHNWSGTSDKDKPAYVHLTTNNTIYGTQWRTASGTERLPAVPDGVPIVADACSDIYSRPIDFTKYGLVYASAQKNLGVTGTTIVFVRDDLVESANANLPRMLQYRHFAKELSMPNTPPAFAIYTVGLMAKWIKAQGGLDALHARNVAKAGVVYAALDAAPSFYKPHARTQDRSLMNIVFKCHASKGMTGEGMDAKLMAEAKAQGLDGLAGHRAAGGMRASLYNAMPHEGAEALGQFLTDFARRNG